MLNKDAARVTSFQQPPLFSVLSHLTLMNHIVYFGFCFLATFLFRDDVNTSGHHVHYAPQQIVIERSFKARFQKPRPTITERQQ